MPIIEKTNNTTPEQIINLIVRELRLRPEEVLLTSNFDKDLGTDSLDKLDLVLAIEDEFRLRVSHDIKKYDTVQDLIDITLQSPKDMRPSSIRKELKKKRILS
jgi:acyl carrier protein